MRKYNIICFSTADWDTPLPTNKHHLMRRLAARGSRVLFIETLGTRAPKLSSGIDVGRIGRRIARSFEGAKKRAKNLWTLSPLVRPVWNSRPAVELNRIAFATQFSSVTRQFPNPIVWIYSPYAIHLLKTVKPSFIVYHAVDDLAAVPGADKVAIREAEAQLLARADLVLCSEKSLFDRMKGVNPNTHFLPNVADFAHFSKPTVAPSPAYKTLLSIGKPRILFSGNLTPHKVDFRLLASLAKANPAWQIVLVGPVWEGGAEDKHLSTLRAINNVTFIGHVEYAELPAHLHQADVLVIPYVENDATRAVFPLKLFEYLATGKPVVTSPLPSLLPYRGAITIAHDRRAWTEAIAAALANPQQGAEQRIALARRHTWQKRIREIEELLPQ